MLRVIVTVCVVATVFLVSINAIGEVQSLRGEIDSLRREVEDLEDDIIHYQRGMDEQERRVDHFMDVVEHIGGWSSARFEITAYAPLDHNAVEGMCHDGDPTNTFSGTYPTAGRTVAVDPDLIPLGTPLWIEGLGWRIAEDIGGAIGGQRIDVMMNSRSDALRWGRRTRSVIYMGRQ